jgi:hypothetical protein
LMHVDIGHLPYRNNAPEIYKVLIGPEPPDWLNILDRGVWAVDHSRKCGLVGCDGIWVVETVEHGQVGVYNPWRPRSSFC